MQQGANKPFRVFLLRSRVDQSALHRDAPDGLHVDAAPVIVTDEHHAPSAPRNVDGDPSGSRLGRRRPLGLLFYAVGHRIADHLNEGTLDGLYDMRIKPNVAAA